MIRRLRVNLAQNSNSPARVGELLLSASGLIYFQFENDFLQSGLSISPLKLKLRSEPQSPVSSEAAIFNGLFGVFDDSLPDGWGRLLMALDLARRGINPSGLTALDHLAYIGDRAMGALCYEPSTEEQREPGSPIDLAQLSIEAESVLEGKSEDILASLFALGGSPGGARPKILVGVENKNNSTRLLAGASRLPSSHSHWIIKFKGKGDSRDSGTIEFIYALAAKKAGLTMPQTRLFPDSAGNYWFGVERFDRAADNRRIHMHSVAGIAHANFRLPSLDYDDILKLTRIVTRSEIALMASFRQLVFNVIFHNRDDHARNFAFLMSDKGQWQVSPSYDLTWAYGPGGQHCSSVMSEGRNPQRQHLLALAGKHGIQTQTALAIIEEVASVIPFMLDQLKQYDVKEQPLLAYLKKISF